MATKIMKYEIKEMIGEEHLFMEKVFDELSYESFRISNSAVNEFWDHDTSNLAFKKEFGHFFKFEDLNLKQRSIHGYVGNKLKKEFTKMNTSSLETLVMKVKKEWSQHKSNIFKGRESMIQYRRDKSHIMARATQFKIEEMGNKVYRIGVRLFNKPYAHELHTIGLKGKGKHLKKKDDSQWAWFKIKAEDHNRHAIMERLISGMYKLGTSYFSYGKRKKKWFLSIAYTFENEKVALNPDNIMGIDLGVRIPAMLAISNNKFYKCSVGNSTEIAAFQKGIVAQRKRMQRQRKWSGNGSIGHGTKTRIKPLDALSGKIKRFKDAKNHAWSRYIVHEAIKNNCGIIQMEDLSGISENESFLKSWTYYDLQEKIRYKAEEKGIEIRMIKPAHTSQRCNQCGWIAKENRDPKSDLSKFKCVACEHEENADVNAARNIAMEGIESIIKEQLEFQEKTGKMQLLNA